MMRNLFERLALDFRDVCVACMKQVERVPVDPAIIKLLIVYTIVCLLALGSL